MSLLNNITFVRASVRFLRRPVLTELSQNIVFAVVTIFIVTISANAQKHQPAKPNKPTKPSSQMAKQIVTQITIWEKDIRAKQPTDYPEAGSDLAIELSYQIGGTMVLLAEGVNDDVHNKLRDLLKEMKTSPFYLGLEVKLVRANTPPNGKSLVSGYAGGLRGFTITDVTSPEQIPEDSIKGGFLEMHLKDLKHQ